MSQPVIGMIGIGQLGLPIAANLIGAGFKGVGFRRNVRAAFIAQGGHAMSSPAEVTHPRRLPTSAVARRSCESHERKTDDRKALSRAIATAKFKSLRGDFRFGPNNYPVQSYHAFQMVNGAAGKPELKLIAENVLKSHVDAYVAQCPQK